MRFWLILLLMLMAASAADAQRTAGPVGEPEGIWRAQFSWIPLNIAGYRYLL